MASTCSRSPTYAPLALLLDVPQLPLDALQRRTTSGRAARRSPCRALRRRRRLASAAAASLIRPSASATNCSLFAASASADSARNACVELRVAAGEQLLAAGRGLALGAQCGGGRRGLRRRPGAAVRSAWSCAAPSSSAAAAGPCARPGRRRRRRGASTVASVAALAASATAARNRSDSSTQHAPAPTSTPASRSRAGTASMPAGCRWAPTEPAAARRAAPSTGPVNRRTVEHVVEPGRGQRGASWSSSHRFTGSPQRNPPSDPSLRSTRWHGTNSAAALRAHADAAARTAAGRPGLRRVLGVADRRARGHRPQHLPGVLEERRRTAGGPARLRRASGRRRGSG